MCVVPINIHSSARTSAVRPGGAPDCLDDAVGDIARHTVTVRAGHVGIRAGGDVYFPMPPFKHE